VAYSTLKSEFYQRDTLIVARELLVKYLVKDDLKLMITEVEAYVGRQDLASHARKGRTARTEVMFKEGGVWYVYFVYGMHWLLNVVTGEKDYPAAVLIRGVEGINGPARVTKAFGIDKTFNALPATKSTGLYIQDRGVVVGKIKSTPRIGVDFAGPVWSQKPYRFLL
jgi:DNA-3-methyladenine glycosylase